MASESGETHEARGVVAALVTPLTPRRGIDLAGVARLVEHAIAGGVHGVAVNTDAGEAALLSRGERLMAARAAVEAAGGRAPVYAGVAAASTDEAIGLTLDAATAGASAVVVAVPHYFHLPQASLVAHYRDIATYADLPLLAHNAPVHATNRLAPDSLARLTSDGVIAGVVERVADLGRLATTLLPVADDFALFAGLDGELYSALSVGARGILSPVAGVAPRQVVAIYDAYRAGDHGRAEASQRQVDALAGALAHESGLAAPCKEALALLGLPAGPVRRPLPDLAARERDAIRAALTQLGLL